jgi:hypothetical protein
MFFNKKRNKMYIIINEDILKRTDLTGDEKVLLSYIQLLTKADRKFFGSEKWCIRNFGFADLESKKRKLIDRGFVSENLKGELQFLGLPESAGKAVQPRIKARTFSNLEKHLKKLKDEGWAVTGESELVIQLWKDDKVINLAKQQFTE